MAQSAAIKNYDPIKPAKSPMFSHIGHVEGNTQVIHTAGQIGSDAEGNVSSSYPHHIRLALANLDIEAVAAVPTDLAASIKAVAPVIPSSTQVVVIGAGLSGLKAAYDLTRAGISTIVLEARNRVGGKTWSVPSANNKGFAECGAAWTNDVNQPRAYGLSQALGIELIEQNISGKVAMEGVGSFSYGTLPELAGNETQNLARAIDTIEEMCQKIDVRRPLDAHPHINSMTFHEFLISLKVGETVQRLGNLWTSAMLGVPSVKVSAVYFLRYCKAGGGFKTMRSDGKGGGQALRFRTGTQSLSYGLHAALPPNAVHLNQAVARVNSLGAGEVVVTTIKGRQITCSKVIVSVPSPIYQKIAFEPALSVEKQELSKNSQHGDYGKCIVVYNEPWWRKRGFCGLSQSLQGPISITRDTSDDARGYYALTCFMVSTLSLSWIKKAARQRHTEVVEQIDRIYGEKCPEPIDIVESQWRQQEWSLGAPCPAIPVDKLDFIHKDGWKPEGDLHFVGTETSTVWTGYMEGALASGERGADEVLLALSKRESARL